MSNQELNLLETTDATVWAKEFVRLNGGDEGLMVTWFANAMCAQMDADRQHDKARYVDFVDSILWFEEADGECDPEQALAQIFNLCREYKAAIDGVE